MSHQSSTNAMMSIEWYEERINEIRAIPMANQCSPAMQDALQVYYRQLVSELEIKKRLAEAGTPRFFAPSALALISVSSNPSACSSSVHQEPR